jgi:hypothetical protein
MSNKVLAMLAVPTALAIVLPMRVAGFCGFYVARADAKLFNTASQVVLARDGDRTVLTMANDFQGNLKEFAIVIPVPTFVEREQIHVGEKALIDHLDAYSAPRMVEYFDENPCRSMTRDSVVRPGVGAGLIGGMLGSQAKSLGVRIEAQYTVGEYDILILSAEQSSGLEQWLRQNGYRIPAGASRVLGSYIKQNMRFFVARVNLEQQARTGFSYLRPLQVAYESPKFMLPIRLGMVNANGPQELFVYALTRTGRVETTNYRTVRLPSGMEIPEYVRSQFAAFYRAMFAEQVRRENMGAVFLEYAWDTGWCDPCAADPLTDEELRKLGTYWKDGGAGSSARMGFGRTSGVFISRLHVRYDAAHFPEDLVFQETGDRANFQGRYVVHHAWTGGENCGAATEYNRVLGTRRERQAQTLASLTGWDVNVVRREMGLESAGNTPARWWERLGKVMTAIHPK